MVRNVLLVVDPSVSYIWVWLLSRLSTLPLCLSFLFFLCPFLIYLILKCLLYYDTCLFPSLSLSPAYPLGLAVCRVGTGEATFPPFLDKRHLVPYHTGSSIRADLSSWGCVPPVAHGG